jgi:VIT1/CCC1 family predicted Fe2+/Mn2+ transporter
VADTTTTAAAGQSTPRAPRASALQKIRQSLYSSAGDIVFGMEDGTVSIFGLVFGVAAGSSSSRTVLLAGATGAVAAAVSMMAGVFLDVESERGKAQSEMADVQARVRADPEQELARVRQHLIEEGLTVGEADGITTILRRKPELLMRYESDVFLQISRTANDSPVGHASWMFVSDLLAAAIPVIPFAIWSIDTARVISVIITTALLVLLGLGRARIAHTAVVRTVVETVGIAAAAASAGLLIGILINRVS